MRYRLLCCLTIAIHSLVACGKSPPSPVLPTQETASVEPTPITFEQQRRLLQTALTRTIAILAGNDSLDLENDPFFGNGEEVAPRSRKDRHIVSYKLATAHAGFEFRKPNVDSPWNEAKVWVTPGNDQSLQGDRFFTAQFFTDLGLVFDRSYREPDENAPDDPNRGDNHFVFKIKDVPNGTAEFISDQHLSNLKDQYPKMFHYCVIAAGN